MLADGWAGRLHDLKLYVVYVCCMSYNACCMLHGDSCMLQVACRKTSHEPRTGRRLPQGTRGMPEAQATVLMDDPNGTRMQKDGLPHTALPLVGGGPKRESL